MELFQDLRIIWLLVKKTPTFVLKYIAK